MPLIYTIDSGFLVRNSSISISDASSVLRSCEAFLLEAGRSSSSLSGHITAYMRIMMKNKKVKVPRPVFASVSSRAQC